MTRFSLLAGFAVSALTISNVVYAGATAWKADAANSTWNHAPNWTNGVPGANDAIKILTPTTGAPPQFTGAGGVANSFSSLELEADAEMYIEYDFIITGVVGNDLIVTGGALLVIDNAPLQFDASSGTASVNGVVQLVDQFSEILISQDTAFTGAGKVELGDPDAMIFIDAYNSHVTLESSITIEGQGRVDADTNNGTYVALFENYYQVAATSGAFAFGPDVTLDPSGVYSAEWLSDGSTSVLRFEKSGFISADTLTVANGGTVKLAANVEIYLLDGDAICGPSGGTFDASASGAVLEVDFGGLHPFSSNHPLTILFNCP